MKKIVIPVVALLLAGVLFISLPLYKRYRVGGFVREFNNIHMLSWSQLDPGYVRADTERGSFVLTSGNLHYISGALTREANMVYHFFRPKTADLPQITLTFPDGAVITVADGGADKNGRDVSYIICTYQGKTRAFSITGLGVYRRVCDCASPEGFGEMGENKPIE